MPQRSTRQVRVTVLPLRDPGLAGLIDDLKLPPDRRARALAVLGQAEVDTTNALTASLKTFRDEVRALVTEEQVAALEERIRNHSRTVRRFLGEIAAPCCRPSFPIPRFDLRALGLTGDALAGAEAASDRHLERTRVLATDRSAILRRVSPVLSAEELAAFAASLERHSAIVTRAEPSPR